MNKVYLYICDLNKIDSLNNLPYLKKSDIDNAKRFKQESDKNEHLISAYFKNKYIKDYYIDENNKPKSEHLFFNISHSKNVVIMGISDKYDIGVDVEKVRNVESDLIDYISSFEEKKDIQTDLNFFEIWTLKESLAKASGKGILRDIKNVKTFPFNGTKEYNNTLYSTKLIAYKDYVIAVCLKINADFDVEIINEIID